MVIHLTSKAYEKSIFTEGLTWEYRFKPQKDNECLYAETVINFLNKYKPKHSHIALQREKCIFMIFDKDIKLIEKTRDLIIEVSLERLDLNKLFIGPYNLSAYISAALNHNYDPKFIKKAAEHYWGNCFRYKDYMQRSKSIGSIFKSIWKVDYTPEIMYTDKIPKELITLYRG